jgi:hypothetical protein
MKIKIFLASSKELEKERLVFADLVGHLNNALESRDITISLVKWEYIDASMGPEHKQEEYNEQLRDCDLCIVLYWTTFGKWTKMELDTAYEEKCAGRNPKKLYVYFKDGEQISEDLQKFRDSFPENYGHFFTNYKNIDTLKAHFLLQFMDYLGHEIKDSGVIEIGNSQVLFNGKPYIELVNVPIVGNNEQYKLLIKAIEDKQMLLSLIDNSHPKYTEYLKELKEAREELQRIEESIWDTALLTTKLSNEKINKNLQAAIDLLNQGDNKGARALLLSDNDEKIIAKNMKLIQIGEEGKKGIKDVINKKLLLIKTYENEMSEGWKELVISLRKEIADITKKAFGKESLEYAMALDSLGYTYYTHDKDKIAEEAYMEALAIFKNDKVNKTTEYATLLIHIGDLFMHQKKFLKAEPYYLDALDITKEKFGDTSIQYALPLYKMGRFYRIFTMYDKAKDCQERSMAIIKQNKGNDVWLHSQTLRELAYCYARVINDYDEERTKTYRRDKKELYQQAFSLISDSVSLIEKNFGQENSTYVSFQIGLSDVLRMSGHHEEAEKVLLQALELSENINDHNESRDMVLHALGHFYLFEPEKAEALGFDYSTVNDIPEVVYGDFGKAFKDHYERKQAIADKLAPRIAELYLKKFPRERKYCITLTSSECANEMSFYHPLSDEEIKILKGWREDPENEEYGISLWEYLEIEGCDDLTDKLLENPTPMHLDTISDCDMDNPLMFTVFSMQILNDDGTFRNPTYITIPLSDEEYLELLAELIKRSNQLSINMLVYQKPKMGQYIMNCLARGYMDYQFDLPNPFVCDMYELKHAAKDILDPFTDVLHLFESEDEEIRKFVIEHQIVENDNDEIFEEHKENDSFHVIAYIESKELVLKQEGVINDGFSGEWHDCDKMRIAAKEMMEKFSLDRPGQIIPYLKEHFGTRDAISQLRTIFKER